MSSLPPGVAFGPWQHAGSHRLTTYDLYKPLRNRMRRLPLEESLLMVEKYIRHLQFKTDLPAEAPREVKLVAGQRPHPYLLEWELALLAKEALINSPNRGTHSLRSWNELSSVLNEIRSLENQITGRYKLIGEDIFLEFFRTAHRQFPWQTRPDTASLVRYFKIFTHEKMAPIFERVTGMTPLQLYVLGLAVVGHFLGSGVLRLPFDSATIGLPQELSDRFVERFSADVPTLRDKALALQSHDHDYAYTLNPLEFHPLVKVPAAGGSALLAPIPTFLFRRFTAGVFYDLCKEADFSDAFGPAFQKYIGDALAEAFTASGIQLLSEAEFHDGKNRRDTIDWIVSDGTAHIFLECKAKRLRSEAKTSIGSVEELNSELSKITNGIVQTYKAISDAEKGLYPHWEPDGLPIYPFIVTLEDWYIFGDRILNPITEMVRAGLTRAGLDPCIVDERPFTIGSTPELEAAAQVMAQVGVERFMSGKTTGEARTWVLHSYMLSAFRTETRQVRASLFPNDLAAAHGLAV